jgi:hypothetical protein
MNTNIPRNQEDSTTSQATTTPLNPLADTSKPKTGYYNNEDTPTIPTNAKTKTINFKIRSVSKEAPGGKATSLCDVDMRSNWNTASNAKEYVILELYDCFINYLLMLNGLLFNCNCNHVTIVFLLVHIVSCWSFVLLTIDCSLTIFFFSAEMRHVFSHILEYTTRVLVNGRYLLLLASKQNPFSEVSFSNPFLLLCPSF